MTRLAALALLLAPACTTYETQEPSTSGDTDAAAAEGGAADAGVTAPCGGTFCDDFEEGAIGRWTALSQEAGTLTLATPGASSLRALWVESAAGMTQAWIAKNFPRTSGALCRMDVMIEKAGSSAMTGVQVQIVSPDFAFYSVAIDFETARTVLTESRVPKGGAPARESVTFAAPPIARWFALTLDMSANGASVSLDGGPATALAIALPATRSEAVLRVGLQANAAGAGWRVGYDNFVCTLR